LKCQNIVNVVSFFHFSPFLALQYSNFWIGANDINVEGEWVWCAESMLTWHIMNSNSKDNKIKQYKTCHHLCHFFCLLLKRTKDEWCVALASSQWVWVSDQSNIQFSDWHMGEPNNAGGEDCGCINLKQEVFQKHWVDGRCSKMYLYICEI
jgi:hypothetical protein